MISFLSNLITSSSLTGQVSRPWNITLCTHAEYNLLFAPKDKSAMADKGTKARNLLHFLTILVISLSTAPPQLLLHHQVTKTWVETISQC